VTGGFKLPGGAPKSKGRCPAGVRFLKKVRPEGTTCLAKQENIGGSVGKKKECHVRGKGSWDVNGGDCKHGEKRLGSELGQNGVDRNHRPASLLRVNKEKRA